MLDKKIKKYLETPETKLPLGAKFVISIPDGEGTNEFANCVNMLQEIKRDNPDYIITLCPNSFIQQKTPQTFWSWGVVLYLF